MDLLRFATIGSVDDGKSTLIGRLLYDTKSIMEDQYEHVSEISRRRGDDRVDLSLVTDGLRAEREQGITIDVAHRYFTTPRRRFVMADCPGHVQYTRNMITGASTADLAVLLVDARHGIVEQTRRHALLVSLLGVPHLVMCINKMDLVDYDHGVFEAIRAEFEAFAARLEIGDITFIPISALEGDNVVDRSAAMSWYQGPSLLHHLENVYVGADQNLIDVRFPVQYVIRADERRYAGRLASGVMRVGDEVRVLPSGLSTTITGIEIFGHPVDEARPGDAAAVLLADRLDIGRGDMICRDRNEPRSTQDLDAMIVWLDHPAGLEIGRIYTLKHTTRTVRARVDHLDYRLDIDTLHRETGASSLGVNDVGRVRLRATAPIFADDYRRNRTTGSFILIDEATHQTVAAGMLRGAP